MKQKINIVLVGPPGAGKGTLAMEIAQKTQLAVLTTSMALRQQVNAGTAFSKKIADLMSSGQLVSDEVIFDVVSNALQDERYHNGVIFDGFPRTIGQANFFVEKGITIDALVQLDLDDDLIVKRMQGRRVHLASGRVYHLENMPPKVEGLDDVTGEPLSIRDDDQEAVVRSRLADYHQITKPVLDWANSELNNGCVKRMIHIDGSATFDQVWQSFSQQLADIIEPSST